MSPLLLLGFMYLASSPLQLVTEKKVSQLVGEEGKYEASGVSLRTKTSEIFVVFDNIPQILIVGGNITKGIFVGGVGVKDEGFEGVTFDFQGSKEGEMEAFAIVESEGDDDDGYYGKLYMYTENLMVEKKQEKLGGIEFGSGNKGFEGLTLMRYPEGQKSHTSRYLFALCEGNSCASGDVGRAGGNGRIKVFAEKSRNDWEFIDTVKLPKTLDFTDYSGVDIDGTNIVVVSQEDSKLWIGELAVKDSDDFYIQGNGTVYEFPRNSDGDIIYCNIEGVAFYDKHAHFPKKVPVANQVYVVSDKAKSDQPDKCIEKEQSIHIFKIPRD